MFSRDKKCTVFVDEYSCDVKSFLHILFITDFFIMTTHECFKTD